MTEVQVTQVEALLQGVLELPRPLLLAWDVDGTLAPITADPTATAVPKHVVTLLDELGCVPDVEVALVTGRDVDTLQMLAPVQRAWRAVQHGAILYAPLTLSPDATSEPDVTVSGNPIGQENNIAPGAEVWRVPLPPSEQVIALEAFIAWAQDQLVTLGAGLETKFGSAAVHVRQMMETQPHQAREVLTCALEYALEHSLPVRQGRALIEVDLMCGNKGDALQKLVEVTGARGVSYCGDDWTDVPALERVQSLQGMAAFVLSEDRPVPLVEGVETLSSVDEVHALVGQIHNGLVNT